MPVPPVSAGACGVVEHIMDLKRGELGKVKTLLIHVEIILSYRVHQKISAGTLHFF